jgi:hypothetical protein
MEDENKKTNSYKLMIIINPISKGCGGIGGVERGGRRG